jgi:hypothetical protein
MTLKPGKHMPLKYFLDGSHKIAELEKQLAKCQENKDGAYLSVAKYLSIISAYKGRVKELEECLRDLKYAVIKESTGLNLHSIHVNKAIEKARKLLEE